MQCLDGNSNEDQLMTTKYEILPEERIINWYLDGKLAKTFYIDDMYDSIERPVIFNGPDAVGTDHMNITLFVRATNPKIKHEGDN